MISELEVVAFAQGLGETTEEFLTEDGGRKSLRVMKREGKIFLVIWEGTMPLRIEVKCDTRLGKLLREKYESVMDSKTLGKGGIEVICSGQLTVDEVRDLVRLSWELLSV